jgi:predicted phosphoribosyltransferase
MKFESRQDAGKLLAGSLKKYGKNSVVLAIPRGGIVVAAEVAKALDCSLDLIIIRKLGAPGNPELAIGATTSKGGLVVDRELIEALGVTQHYLHEEHLKQLAEARRREKVYTKGKAPEITGKVAILVDDGIATGATVEAAINAVKEELPSQIVVATPVAPPSTVERLKKLVDDVVVSSEPEPFYAIGEFYVDFPQVTDEEVIKILKEVNQNK